VNAFIVRKILQPLQKPNSNTKRKQDFQRRSGAQRSSDITVPKLMQIQHPAFQAARIKKMKELTFLLILTVAVLLRDQSRQISVMWLATGEVVYAWHRYALQAVAGHCPGVGNRVGTGIVSTARLGSVGWCFHLLRKVLREDPKYRIQGT
jgi:hypothetical protein